MSARSKVLAPVATVVAVVAVAGTAALISHGGSAGKPKPLRLAAGSGTSQDTALSSPPMAAKIAGGSYTLTGTLPSGSPDDGRAYTLPRGFASTSVVAKLANALGAPTPVKGKQGWTAGGLNVSSASGQGWFFSPCGPAAPVPSPAIGAPEAPIEVCSGVGFATDTGTVSSGSLTTPGGGASGSGGVAVAPPQALAALPPACSFPAPPAGSTPTPELKQNLAGCPSSVSPPVLCGPPAPSTLPPGAKTNGLAPCSPPPCGFAAPGVAAPGVAAPGGAAPDVAISCVAPPPPPEPPTPTASEVKAAAAPVLSALGIGIDESNAQVQTYPGGGSVTVDPKVDGLDTVGLATSIGVDGSGKITNANGFLSVPEAGDRYPLISAQKAFDTLPTFARELLCPVGPDGQGCTEPQPQEITGAHLGLSVAYLSDDVMALLPTWLFDLKGQDQPIPGVAVDPTYLQQQTPATPEPGISPPGEPGGPVSSNPEPAPAFDPIPLMSWTISKADNAVTVTYDAGGCGVDGVTADVKEDDKQVYVFLHGHKLGGSDAICPAISKPTPYEVALQGPLGARTVVDGTNGTQVPKA